MAHDSNNNEKKGFKKLFLLALGALGVVYGDIGTSPLYAINEIFFGHAHLHRNEHDILGAISLVLWALTIVVAFKYIFFVLRADNHGEGGVFALYSLLHRIKFPLKKFTLLFLILAAGLLFGDGIITPAISVVSAIEGLKIVTPFFEPFVVPITIAILTGLFMIQKNGTTKVGAFFGPIIVLWFTSIGLIGLSHLLHQPGILLAFNPLYALNFLTTHPLHQVLLTLGSVMLVVTGGEAMYADLGHFGRLPIRISWFALTYPALILNYLGQGAYLLSEKTIASGNIFFSMAPSWGLIPMVILATLATIIASQALISGAFSLTMQAIQIGLLPYVHVKHTHEEHRGQIYIPFINWSLYIGCVLLVVIFQKSTNLASAYGLAVSGVMLATSLSMILISKYLWKWSFIKTLILWVPLVIIDASFLTANSLKFFSGGYIPLIIGLIILVIMITWEWGREHVDKTFKELSTLTLKDIILFKKTAKASMPKSFVVFTKIPLMELDDRIPALKLLVDRYGMLPKHLVFLHVAKLTEPYAEGNRFEVKNFYEDSEKGSISGVALNFGYMEERNVESVLEELAQHKLINIEDNHKEWRLHVVHEHIIRGEFKTLVNKLLYKIYNILHRITMSSDFYFGLGKENKMTIEELPVYIR